MKGKMLTCPVCGQTKRVDYRQKTCSHECSRAASSGSAGPTENSDSTAGDTRTISRCVEQDVKNEKQLAQVCGIDLDEWRIVSWRCRTNTWGGFAKIGKRGSERIQTVENRQFRVDVTLERNRPVLACKAAIDKLVNQTKKKAPKFNIVRHRSKSGVALEIGPYDHHFAGLAWSSETNWANWDTDIATSYWHAAIEKLLARVTSPKIERVFLVMGNDLFHVDSPKNETFAGTRQDMDTRWDKMVDHVVAVVKGTVDSIAEHVAPVEILPVDGNHDPTSVRWLARILEAHYSRNANVKVRRDPTKRKVIEWGQNLVMVSHAERAVSRKKFHGLANLLAVEHPEEWGRTQYREVHTGHLHHEISEDIFGVVVRRLRSLMPPNAWASEEHYVGSQRGAEAFEWDREEGLISILRYNAPGRENGPA